MKEFVKALLDRAPIAIFLLGLILAAVSILGFIPGPKGNIDIPSPSRVPLGLLGGCILVFASVMIWDQVYGAGKARRQFKKKYGMKFSRDRMPVRTRRHKVHGTFERQPSERLVRVFERNMDNSLLYPYPPIYIDATTKTWFVDAYLGGKTPHSKELRLAHVSPGVEALIRYYYKLGEYYEKIQKTNNIEVDCWIGFGQEILDLPQSEILWEDDRVTVNFEPPPDDEV
jgi:hypothetical protein